MTSKYENFTFAITAIAHKYSNEIRDIILNQPENQSYEALKSELVRPFVHPEKKRYTVLWSSKKLEIVVSIFTTLNF